MNSRIAVACSCANNRWLGNGIGSMMSLNESLNTSANLGDSWTGSLCGSVIEIQTSCREGSYAVARDIDSTTNSGPVDRADRRGAALGFGRRAGPVCPLLAMLGGSTLCRICRSRDSSSRATGRMLDRVYRLIPAERESERARRSSTGCSAAPSVIRGSDASGACYASFQTACGAG